ncbi:MAG: hypothetical protein LBG22_11275 [Treponema sp.]|nr:hypothetical protein [Treponema sp.]
MNRSIGSFLWQIAVALYLFANGVLGIQKGGDFKIIYGTLFSGDLLTALTVITGIIALLAGILVLLELFNVEIGFLDTLVLVVAIVWLVYVVIEIFGWISGKYKQNFLHVLQLLAVHLMVLGSLLVASKKFDR